MTAICTNFYKSKQNLHCRSTYLTFFDQGIQWILKINDTVPLNFSIVTIFIQFYYLRKSHYTKTLYLRKSHKNTLHINHITMYLFKIFIESCRIFDNGGLCFHSKCAGCKLQLFTIFFQN